MKKYYIILFLLFLSPYAFSGIVVTNIPEAYNEGNNQRTVLNSGISGDNNWATAYHYGVGSADEIFYSYTNDGNVTWAPEIQLGNSINVQTQSTAIDRDKNNIVVAWTDRMDPDTSDYFYHIRKCPLLDSVDSCGTLSEWTPDFNMNLIDASWALTTNVKIPSLSCDFNSGNILHCVLTTDAPYAVVHTYINSDLNITEPSNWVIADVNVADTGSTQTDRTGMMIDGNDMMAVSWIYNNDDWYYSRRPSDLTTGWSTPIIISDNVSGTTDLVSMDWSPVDFNHSLVYSGTDTRLNYYWREFDGTTLGPAIKVPTRVSTSPASIFVAVDYNGASHIFMDDRGAVANDRNVSHVIIYANDLITPSIDVNSDDSGDPLSANMSRFSRGGVAMINYAIDITAATGYDTIVSDFLSGVGSPVPSLPDITLTFVDEDTNVLLSPSVTVSGGTTCTISNGSCDFNITGSSATITASLTNYGTRSWTFGYDKDNPLITKTLTMLRVVDGTTVPFTLRDVTGDNLIKDGNITILHQDNNYMAGRFKIGSSGSFSTFLSPFDQNYTFVVEYSGSDFNFTRNTVKVKIPKDEYTTSNITPYDVKMRGIGIQNVLSSSVENRFRVFPYTDDFYITDVNATSYYGRNYYFRLSRSDYDENVSLNDEFTGSDSDPVNSSTWLTFNDGGTSNVMDIQDNDLNIFAYNSTTIGAISDQNFVFEIGDSIEFEFISVARPTKSGGSPQYGGGWMVDNNANPITAEIGFQIRRDTTGILYLYHASDTAAVGYDQLDGSAGEIPLKIRLTRDSADQYTSEFYLGDSNKLAKFTDTVSHHTFKVSLFGRGGAGDTMAGKFDDAKVFDEDFYEIQPYLAQQAQANQVTVRIQKIFEATTKLEGIRVVSNAYIEGAGLQQVETVVTDSQGQGVMSFLTDGTEYNIYLYNSDDELLHTFRAVISPSQTVLSISTQGEAAYPETTKKRITVALIPGGGTIASIDTNIIARVYYDVNVTITDINIIIQQKDVNLADFNASSYISASPFEITISSNVAGLDTYRQWFVIVHITTADGNSAYFAAIFNLAGGKVGGVDLLNDIIRGDFKTELGCQADDWVGFCFPTFMLSMLLTAVFTAALLGAFQVRNPNLAVIFMLFLLGVFTYFYWIPVLFLAGLVVFAALVGIALVRVNL